MQPDSKQQAKLEAYVALLLKWQKSINLISSNTVNHIWDRHIEDSLQIVEHLPEAGLHIDLGSGGGLPAVVIAIMRPELEVVCIESVHKKCVFLQNVSRETMLPNLKVLSGRIEENIAELGQAASITARALASLDKLLEMVLPVIKGNKSCICVFPKGQQWEKELAAAKEKFDFCYDIFPSKTEKEAVLLRISAVHNNAKTRLSS